jgi:hypothetical protein
MGTPRTYVSDFDNERRVAFVRARAQVCFRNEQWDLTWEDFQAFWRTRRLWDKRGRHNDDLVLTRIDWDKSWNRDNCCIITRENSLKANIAKRWNKPADKYFEEAIKYEPF